MTTDHKPTALDIHPLALVPDAVPEEDRTEAVSDIHTFLQKARAVFAPAEGADSEENRPARIETQAMRTIAAEIVAHAKRRIIYWKSIMEKPKKTANAAHKAACDAENTVCKPFVEVSKYFTQLINEYDTEQERIRREQQKEEQRKAQEELEKARLEVAVVLEDSGAVDSAEAMITNVVAPPVKSTKPAPAKPKGNYTVEVWHFEVTDPAVVPDGFWMINETALQAVADEQKDMASVPGVRFHFTIENRFRS